jgi:hypothetical protein
MQKRATRLALAGLAILMAATLAACGSDRPSPVQPAQAGPVATTPSKPTTAQPAGRPAAGSVATGPSRSTAATGMLPRPIRVVHQGDRLFGVYWLAASAAALSPVQRRLQALGIPASSGELDCDQGARRELGVPATITSRVAVYFGTEQDARAFAEGVDVRPRPSGHAAAILYCLD